MRFGGKPFIDYFIDKYNQMWWNSFFGTNRLYWLKNKMDLCINANEELNSDLYKIASIIFCDIRLETIST